MTDIEAEILRDAGLRPTTLKIKGLTVNYEYYPTGAISKIILSGPRASIPRLFEVLNMIYPRDVTVNIARVPATTTEFTGTSVSIQANETKVLITKEGQGTCDYIVFHVAAASGSEGTTFRVFCDGERAWGGTMSTLNAYGYGASTPQVSLIAYGVDGVCAVVVSKKFTFQESLRLTAFNNKAQTVTYWFSADLMKT